MGRLYYRNGRAQRVHPAAAKSSMLATHSMRAALAPLLLACSSHAWLRVRCALPACSCVEEMLRCVKSEGAEVMVARCGWLHGVCGAVQVLLLSALAVCQQQRAGDLPGAAKLPALVVHAF